MSRPAALIHHPASMVDGTWLGREVMVGRTVVGTLSDVAQVPSKRTTVLYLSGRVLPIRSDTTVIFDGLGIMGGAA